MLYYTIKKIASLKWIVVFMILFLLEELNSISSKKNFFASLKENPKLTINETIIKLFFFQFLKNWQIWNC